MEAAVATATVGGGMRKTPSHASIVEQDDFDLSRLLDKPRLNIERQRSFDDRSMSEFSIGGNIKAGVDGYDPVFSPGILSGLDTPLSSRNSFEPHPMVGEAWEALRRSLVYFKGQPVGTIAAYDHASEEVLNYDQVRYNCLKVLFLQYLSSLLVCGTTQALYMYMMFDMRCIF